MDAGGAERVAASLCNYWAESGHSIYLVPTYSGGGASFYVLSPSVQVQYLSDLIACKNKTLRAYFFRLVALRKIISKSQADVVISFLPNVNIASILVSRFTGVPTIISERRDPSSQPLSLWWELSCRFFYRLSDALVVQTEGVRGKVREIYPGLKNITCIPNPIPPDLLIFKPRLNGRSRKILLSLGRLSPEKQVDHTVRCFSRLIDECLDWDLHIYGDGPCREDLEFLVSSLNLATRIRFMGRSSEPWEVISNADAFVMTSRSEGFPNALLESMAMGLPCVSYDCPSGPRDISSDGVDAILVAPQDQENLYLRLSQLLKDEKLRQDLGRRAKASVMARYAPKAISRQWDALFGDLGLKIGLE